METFTSERGRLVDIYEYDQQCGGGRCQSKIPNTWSGYRTAGVDPEKSRKINDPQMRFCRFGKVIEIALTVPQTLLG